MPGSNVMLHLRSVGHAGFEGSALQNNNVSFTMSDKSAIPFGKLVHPSSWLILLLINDPKKDLYPHTCQPSTSRCKNLMVPSKLFFLPFAPLACGLAPCRS